MRVLRVARAPHFRETGRRPVFQTRTSPRPHHPPSQLVCPSPRPQPTHCHAHHHHHHRPQTRDKAYQEPLLLLLLLLLLLEMHDLPLEMHDLPLEMLDLVDLGLDLVEGLLGIAEEHVRVVLVEDRVVGARVARAHRALHHDDLLGRPHA
jgi:hypothetical protein